jgi:low affinity Fe/Cu permease
MNEYFRKFAQCISEITGSPWAFILAASTIAIWIITGPFFSFSDTWQLVINTGTTIVTFLMVFLIQNTQNRDSKAIQLKLDELIRAVGDANNSMIDIEELSDKQLQQLQQSFRQMHDAAGTEHISGAIQEEMDERQQEDKSALK